MSYEPSPDDWQARPPAELGMDRETLALAIDYHRGHETHWPRDFLTESGRYIGVADESPTRDEVPGSHWGGGLWMSTRDHARLGLLVHRAGCWQGRALLPAAWVEEMRRPCPINQRTGSCGG